MSSQPAPPAPVHLIVNGLPQLGTFAGLPGDSVFGRLGRPYVSGLRTHLVEKRWVYALVSAPDVFLCVAVVDLGYLSSAFLGVFDRAAKKVVFDQSTVLPPGFSEVAEDAGPGLHAKLSGPNKVRIERDGDRVRVEAHWGKAAVDLSLETAHALPALGVCASIEPQRFNYTQKWVGLQAGGEIKLGKVTYSVSGAPAGMDFTHGQSARETNWRWAFATGSHGGRRVGFNFSEGFLGKPGDDGAENAVWIDGAPLLVGPVKFTFDPKNPNGQWTIKSADGSVDLSFTPEGQRTMNANMGLILSRYAQPFGTFRGTLTAQDGTRVHIEGLAGVTEDHSARW